VRKHHGPHPAEFDRWADERPANLGRTGKKPRAAIIRNAIDAYLDQRKPAADTKVFGLWKDRKNVDRYGRKDKYISIITWMEVLVGASILHHPCKRSP